MQHKPSALTACSLSLFLSLTLSRLPCTAGYSCWDQPGLSDSLYSTVVGRPFFGACMRVSDDHGDPLQQARLTTNH